MSATPAVARKGRDWVGAAAPTVDNDSTQGQAVGDRWVDTSGPATYTCTDDSPGEANWVEEDTGGGGGGSGTPASSVVVERTLNHAADAVGTSTDYARADHTHGTPAMPSASDVGALGATAAAGGDLAGNYPNPTLSSAIKTTIEGIAEAAAEAYSDAALAAHVAASDPHAGYQKESEKDANSGYAGLDSGGLVGPSHLPIATTAARGAVVLESPVGSDTSGSHVVTADDGRLSDARAPTGAAGGDLTGTYPNPTLRLGKILGLGRGLFWG